MNGIARKIILIDAETIAASGTSTSCLELNMARQEGVVTLELHVTGDGTCTMKHLGADKDGTYRYMGTTSGDEDILTDATKTSGPGGNGIIIDGYNLTYTELAKFEITETGGADSVTITLVAHVQ